MPQTFTDVTPIAQTFTDVTPVQQTAGSEQPGLLDQLATPPSQGEFESAMKEGGLAPTLYGAKNLVAGAAQGVKGAVGLISHPIDTVKGMVQGIKDSGSQIAQVPGAIRDINASADPTGTYVKAAGDTAGQAGGQAALALATEGAVKLPGALKTALSKSGVTSEMAAKLSTSLDTVAKDAGLPKSAETSLSGKAADTVKGLKGQAQKIYGDLDKASGGRYQRFVDEIDTLDEAMRNKYVPPQEMPKLQQQLAQVKSDFAAVQKQLVSQGIDPKIIAKGDVKWAQAKALEAVGKKFKTAESLSGELKPGTSSVDTGLKNLKNHILPQATKGEASGITDTVVNATNKLSKVKRNQTIAKVAAGTVGAGGLAYGLTK